MARTRNLQVGAINIVIQDTTKHAPAFYRELLEALYALEKPVRLQGEQWLLIGYLDRENTVDSLSGLLDRYIEIDNFNWYNKLQRRPASKDEMGRIRIPDALEANHREYFLHFDLNMHRLVFLAHDTGLNLNARQVQKLFRTLLADKAIKDRFGTVTVSIEQEPGKLQKILNAPHLRQISINVNRANDTFGGLDSLFTRGLEQQRAASARLELKADDGGSLAPSKEVQDLATVAASNGEVSARVFEDGHIKIYSSKDFPLLERVPYLLKTMSRLQAFKKAVRKILHTISKDDK